MKLFFEKIIHLEGWEALAVDESLVLLHQDEQQAKLIEITKDDEVNILFIDDEPDPAYDESHAWLIARVIQSMKKSEADDWDGDSPLLPIAFDHEDVPCLRALAALAYCWHAVLPTLIYGDAESGYLHHVHFDGACWMISVTGELELDYILQI